MSCAAVSVKWQKEVFPAVEIDTEQPPYVFKCQLYDLTGVPPERQKIMIKGGLLKVALSDIFRPGSCCCYVLLDSTESLWIPLCRMMATGVSWV